MFNIPLEAKLNWMPMREQNMLDDTIRNWRPPAAIAQPAQLQAPQPVSDNAGGNELRPTRFDEIIGQDKVKSLMRRMVGAAIANHRSLDHVLLTGPSGTGKTTLASVIAHEMGRDLYHIEAPISQDTLLALRTVMQDGDVLMLDEIHQQALQERRGKGASTSPETLFTLLEDFVIPTQMGLLPFPRITVIGATTDPGLLPTPFLNRFPLRPRLEKYTIAEMEQIAAASIRKLGLTADPEAITTFAGASRSTPREVNNFVRNAASLTDRYINVALAKEVIHDLNSLTTDGLDITMQDMLKFLYQRCKRTTRDGEVRYQGSVSSIATGVGLSRDQKAVQLHVEPTLIERGYVQVLHGGRCLSDAGVMRAQSLLQDGVYG